MSKIEVITGPMFSGKTTELMRRLERYALAGKKIAYFVPDVDTRTQEYVKIASIRQEQKIKVQRLPLDLSNYNHMWPLVDVVAIDEVQFFDDSIIRLCQSLKDLAITVIVSGLDMDYLRRPFGCIGGLMAVSDTVTKLTAICHCGNEAQFTQRLRNGSTVVVEEDLVQIGDDSYAPRCHDCYRVPPDKIVCRN